MNVAYSMYILVYNVQTVKPGEWCIPSRALLSANTWLSSDRDRVKASPTHKYIQVQVYTGTCVHTGTGIYRYRYVYVYMYFLNNITEVCLYYYITTWIHHNLSPHEGFVHLRKYGIVNLVLHLHIVLDFDP